MVIRHLINSDEDIIRLFGKRFLERLQVLVRMYNEKYKDITHTTAVKLANVALGFCLAASGGEQLTCQDYEAMLYGHSQECLTLDDMPMMLDEEDWRPTEGLIWDATCLMLEEKEALPQVAYDIADRHVKYAYKSLTPLTPSPVESGQQVSQDVQEVPVENTKQNEVRTETALDTSKVFFQEVITEDLYLKGQQDAVQKIIDTIKGSHDLQDIGSELETLLSRLSRRENHIFDVQLDDLAEWNMDRKTVGDTNVYGPYNNIHGNKLY